MVPCNSEVNELFRNRGAELYASKRGVRHLQRFTSRNYKENAKENFGRSFDMVSVWGAGIQGKNKMKTRRVLLKEAVSLYTFV